MSISPTFYTHSCTYQKPKNDSEVIDHFALLGSTHIKAACKHVGEIDPRCQFHQHFISSILRTNLFSAVFIGLQFDFVIFCLKTIGVKAAHKLLLKQLQATVIDGKSMTTTDTGIAFRKISK